MADVCRCHLPVDPPDNTGPHWWPSRHPEPDTTVQAVALVGQDPAFLRAERRPGQVVHRRPRPGAPRIPAAEGLG